MMDKFPILTLLSQLLRFFGWFVVVAGLILFVGSVGASEHSVLGNMRIVGIVGSTVVVGNGLILVVVGEAIGVLFAIEHNTRRVEPSAFLEQPVVVDPT